jgi:hypothetical protein
MLFGRETILFTPSLVPWCCSGWQELNWSCAHGKRDSINFVSRKGKKKLHVCIDKYIQRHHAFHDNMLIQTLVLIWFCLCFCDKLDSVWMKILTSRPGFDCCYECICSWIYCTTTPHILNVEISLWYVGLYASKYFNWRDILGLIYDWWVSKFKIFRNKVNVLDNWLIS